MKNFRTYGNHPYRVALVHGGPGGQGQMASVAKELAKEFGVLEPLQTKNSIKGQIEELHITLEEQGDTPMVLIGHSWGAMLSILCAAKYPDQVKKLILISCGPLEAGYSSADVMKSRLEKMSDEDRLTLNTLLKKLEEANDSEKNYYFAKLCHLATRTDSYEPAQLNDGSMEAQYDIFKSVWDEAELFRKNGGFEDAVQKIKCHVTAFHGDFDPHPSKGITKLLSATLKDFRYIQIEKCGHYPWIEKNAKDNFYAILRGEICHQSDLGK